MKVIQKYLLRRSCREIEKFANNDQDLFYKYVDNSDVNITAFENNWSYILQATRGEGMKIEKNKSVIYFWLRKGKELVVVNRLGKNWESVIDILNKECKKLGIVVVVKNVDERDAETLKGIGFSVKDYPWSSYSFMDDNTFPQIVADVEGIIKLKPKALRESHRLYIKRFIKTRNIKVVPYDDNSKKAARSLLIQNSKYLEGKNVESKKEVYDAHVFFFNNDLKDVCRLAFEESGKQIAFQLFTVRKGVIYWNALVNKDESNLMLYLLWSGIKYVVENSQEPIKNLSLQGCETEGQYKWKQGFYPLESIKKVHMVSN